MFRVPGSSLISLSGPIRPNQSLELDTFPWVRVRFDAGRVGYQWEHKTKRVHGSIAQGDMRRTGPPLVVDHRGGNEFQKNFQQAMGPVRRSAPGPAVEGGYASSQTMFVRDVALDDASHICGNMIMFISNLFIFGLS